MANTIIVLKKSGQTGNVPAALSNGELAINFADGKLFYKNAIGSIVSFPTGGSSSNSFATINSNGSLILATSATDILTLSSQNNIVISTNTVSKTISLNVFASGSNTGIQYNKFGSFSSDVGFTWNDFNQTLSLTGTDPGIVLNNIVNEPLSPAANTGRFYVKSIANRPMPKFIGSGDFDYSLQPHVGLNNIRKWSAGANTSVTAFADQIGSLNYTSASPGGVLIPTLTTTNLRNQTYRCTISSGGTAGGVAYIRGNQLPIWRGNAVGFGGFFTVIRFSLSTLVAGQRIFAGLVDTAANPTNVDPNTSTTPGSIGIAANTNSGNWKIVYNTSGSARTSLDLGANFPINANDMIELTVFCKPNDTVYNYRVVNLTNNLLVTNTASTNVPTNTTFLTPSIWITNNATAAVANLDFISTYVETDY